MNKKQEEKNNLSAKESDTHQLKGGEAEKLDVRLRDIELQKKAILNNIPDIAWLKDSQSRFIAVNDAFGSACGFLPDELIGKTDLDIWPKELAENYRADDREVMRSGKRKCIEERLVDKSEKIQWIETIKTPIFDDKGKVVGTAGIARDITERKKSEERLKEIRAELEIRVKVRTAELTRVNEDLRKEARERAKAEEALYVSEERFRTIADFTYDWEYWQDKDKRMIYVSPSCERITGYTANDFMDDLELIEKIVHPDDITLLLKQIKHADEYCTKMEMDFRIIDRNGQIHWISHICVPIYNKENKFLGRRASNRDVTEKKNYEAELQIYREKLEILVEQRTKLLELEIDSRKAAELHAKALRQQLEFILGATKTGLDIIDQNFYIRYIDPEWAKRYGDWANKKCFDYFMGRETPCPGCAIEQAFKTKKPVVSEEILVKEGNRPIQVTTIPFQDEFGEWLVAEINTDISERKKIDLELWHYRDHLEDLVEERSGQLLQEISLHKEAEIEKNKLNQALLKSYEKLKSISLIDTHTGLYNHRYLADAIEAEFHQSRRYAQNLALILLDIDYFKSINDLYGLTFGDLVLKQLAKQLKRMVRRYDILIRYSGEEFIIISPRLNRNLALNMAQRLLESINFINFGNKQHVVKLKLSLAAVSFPEDRITKGIDLVNLANDLLNRAKESGGNRAYSTLDMQKSRKKSRGKIIGVSRVKSLRNTINKLTKKSNQGLVESIFAFAKTIELKDHYTGEHVENTVHYATEISEKLGLAREDVELIKQAAMLHDLGKIGISEHILLKKGKLSKKEYTEIKKHPQIGADIIRPIQFLHALIPFIFYHHERWDGKGYPSGIKGEDIPVGARIIAIADVYQALTSDRPYHKAYSKNEAINIIKKASGKQFDPRIAGIFLKIIEKEK